jgi:uncharacterized protein YjiS (DUF1127 family)
MRRFRLSRRRAARILAAMRLLQRLFRSWFVAPRTRRELHALSDHALRDIGLDRQRIDALFR